jgi:hypothetical protein
MQGTQAENDALEFLDRHGQPGMSLGFAKQLVALQSDPERRYASAELLALATMIDPGFTRRTLSDWPKWGLLALATTSGRGPNGGVERTWSAAQVQVFLLVVRKRLQGHRRRPDLANLPVFMWLLLGAEHVPHEQVRRAIATWANSARNLSSYRSTTDSYHAVLRSPRVQELLEQGSLTKKELHARAEAAPTIDDVEGLAGYLGGFGAPNGSGMPGKNEIAEMTRRHKLALRALQRGIDVLPTVTDAQLDAARSRYRGSANLDFLPDLDADLDELAAAVTSRRFKTEGETACSNALTFLGVVCQERADPTISLDRLLRIGQGLAAELTGGFRSVLHTIQELITT